MGYARILLVDDDDAFLELFSFMASGQPLDVDVVACPSAEKALDRLKEEAIDLVISDVQMPEMTGTELFREVQDLYPEIPVILITAFGSAQEAIEAVKEGAFHYFEKPINDKLDLFWTTIREALAKRRMAQNLASLHRERSFRSEMPLDIVGQSQAIREVIRSLREISELSVSVLIQGETGTGKELAARVIHHLSDRKEKPFFAVSCNEFAAGVLESELFGHERGAFTGAIGRKMGLFELAHMGTLFLDEIGEAAPFFQSKLLRVVESKTFMRVGGTFPIQSDFRLLTATNRDLEKEVARGAFRQDLLYRLNLYTIEMPALRHRKDDIPLIADFYLKRFAQAYRRPVSGISTNALLHLRNYDWPGNVRELINVVERAVITCRGDVITTKHFPFESGEYRETPDLNLRDVEKFCISMALTRTGNNKSQAADLLGITRKTLIEKARSLGLDEAAKDK
ncbi:MAG: sigma-54 dependent transcriptional regulator [Thermodesulfobacteriota bacterium]|nr:sigma-54 dependent transcriptional regulator [Thermodesulfobacteriota bacterium]